MRAMATWREVQHAMTTARKAGKMQACTGRSAAVRAHTHPNAAAIGG